MKESEPESQFFPEWEVVYYKDSNIVIIHRTETSVHGMLPPWHNNAAERQWSPTASADWLLRHRDWWNNINCSCGHWVKIPRPIIEQFIAKVNLLRRA